MADYQSTPIEFLRNIQDKLCEVIMASATSSIYRKIAREIKTGRQLPITYCDDKIIYNEQKFLISEEKSGEVFAHIKNHLTSLDHNRSFVKILSNATSIILTLGRQGIYLEITSNNVIYDGVVLFN